VEPYRSAPSVRAAETPRDAGIVDDIIRQFADPMAFYRELVQNAIDAGTDAVDVRLRFGDDAVKIAVIDRGEGMTRDILENRLLVLFRSTKEKDDDKIGKFGVGFASVLALSPTVVSVTTVRDGRRLALHLFRDLSYELYDAGPAEISGTIVELDVPLRDVGSIRFIADSVNALVRWCRHARVPIRLVARDSAGEVMREERIDRPLALDRPLVQVSGESGDGMLAVVGIERGLRPYAGFFNHGLTLYETSDPAFGRLAFKVQDPRLGHTMSRDNVRRDRRFDEALGFVRQLARRELSAATAAALLGSLESKDLARYAELLQAIAALAVGMSREQVVFPLVEPIDGERHASAATLRAWGAWVARSSSPITRALAGAGIPVVALCDEIVRSTLRSTVGVRGDADSSLTLITPVERSGADEALVDRLGALLDRAHRRPPAIHLATLEGARSGEIAITSEPSDSIAPRRWLAPLALTGGDPFAWLLRSELVLNARHPMVDRARRRAASDPLTAASILARLLMLQHGDLDRRRSEALAVETIARILGEGER
jgi:molecular chaperone HtpG